MVTVCLFGITSWMPEYLVETLVSWVMGFLAFAERRRVGGAWIAGIAADRMKTSTADHLFMYPGGLAIWLAPFKNPWAAAFMISVATGVAYIAVPIWYVLLQKSVNPGAMVPDSTMVPVMFCPRFLFWVGQQV